MSYNLHTKSVDIELAKIRQAWELNPRKQDEASYTDDALMSDLLEHGQLEDGILEQMDDGTFVALRGNRRIWNLQRAASMGLKYNPELPTIGDKIPTTVRAKVFKGLTPIERAMLRLDHGNIRRLSKAELFFAVEIAFRAGCTEKSLATLLFGLLSQHYPPPAGKDLSTPESKLNYYRGVIQTMRAVYNAPTLLRDQYVRKLDGQSQWPKKSELLELLKLHNEDSDPVNDKLGKVSQANPGPRFMAKWRQVVTENAKAAENGEARAKSVSMMSRKEVADLGKGATSRIVKIISRMILRDSGTDVSELPNLDKRLAEMESNHPDKEAFNAYLDGLFAGKEDASK